MDSVQGYTKNEIDRGAGDMRPAQIMEMVAEVCGVTIADMQGASRLSDILFAKYITVMILTEDQTDDSEIVALFPKHNRIGTLYHCRDAFNDLILYDRLFKNWYLECIKTLDDN